MMSHQLACVITLRVLSLAGKFDRNNSSNQKQRVSESSNPIINSDQLPQIEAVQNQARPGRKVLRNRDEKVGVRKLLVALHQVLIDTVTHHKVLYVGV